MQLESVTLEFKALLSFSSLSFFYAQICKCGVSSTDAYGEACYPFTHIQWTSCLLKSDQYQNNLHPFKCLQAEFFKTRGQKQDIDHTWWQSITIINVESIEWLLQNSLFAYCEEQNRDSSSRVTAYRSVFDYLNSETGGRASAELLMLHADLHMQTMQILLIMSMMSQQLKVQLPQTAVPWRCSPIKMEID